MEKKPIGKSISVRTAYIERIRVAFLRTPKRSAYRQSQRLALSRANPQRKLHQALGLKTYKFQLVQKRKDTISNKFSEILEKNAKFHM